jgi:hypothetical protein
MADQPDIQQLAEIYLDLWERQIAATAANPEMAQAMAVWLVPLRRMMRGDDPHGPAAAGAPPRPGGPGDSASPDRLDRLEQRVAALEQRLAGGKPANRGRTRRR